MARIDLYRDGRLIKSLALGERTYLIGRDPACDLVLEDTLVSRRHCQLLWQGNEYLLKDLDTGNGTLVNGVREFSKVLRVASTLQVGQEMMLFDPEAPAEETPDDDELPAWAMSIADDDDDDSLPATAHLVPTELHRMQAKVRARQRPHLVVRGHGGSAIDIHPLDTKVSPIGFGPVRISLGASSKGKEQVLAEATRLNDGTCRIKALGLFNKFEHEGKKKKDVLLRSGGQVIIGGIALEYHAGLEGGG
jgi:hypothetical protein